MENALGGSESGRAYHASPRSRDKKEGQGGDEKEVSSKVGIGRQTTKKERKGSFGWKEGRKRISIRSRSRSRRDEDDDVAGGYGNGGLKAGCGS